jgi:hypothetical protein
VPVLALHHQAVSQNGAGLVTVARADDQVVEALELEGRRFTVGIQWHPEEGNDLRVLEALVAAATPATASQEGKATAKATVNGKDSKKTATSGKPAPAAGQATR